MKKYIDILTKCALFRGVDASELEGLLKCLSVQEKTYDKNESILIAGTRVNSIGILIEGAAQILREDADGNRAILSDLNPADLFGEAYAAAGWNEIPITVVATGSCLVLWIPFHAVVEQCSFSCDYHKLLIENLIKLIAEKNILMNEKMRLLSCKTTREKLLTYLRDYSEIVGTRRFKIPFSRNELADYISVDRSAMSRELGILRDQGLIQFHKNAFELSDQVKLRAKISSIILVTNAAFRGIIDT